MAKIDEVELFTTLSRNSAFREWVEHEIADDFAVLSHALDVEQIRRAQGRVGILQKMLKLLDDAPAALMRRENSFHR